MNNDVKLLSEAYLKVLESKKKLSPAQKEIAAAAPPPDEITGADFKALKKKKDSAKIAEAYQNILEASATDNVVNKKDRKSVV